MSSSITTLVLPVAGRGTRLQPLTNDRPKALVELSSRPLLSYFLEEAVLSDITDVVLIISPEFLGQFEAYLSGAQVLFPQLRFHLYIQTEPWGHGRALLTAYDFLKGKPFIVRFSDDVIFSDVPTNTSLRRAFELHNAPIILLEKVPIEKISQYGVVGISESFSEDLHHISHFVEKPDVPPSDLAVVGGYVFTPELLEHLREADPCAPQVADGLLINEAFYRELAREGKIVGLTLSGRRFDCGGLEGFQAAERFLSEKDSL